MKTNIKSDLKKAKNLLQKKGYTCVFIKDENIIFSSERGVKPLLEILDNNQTLFNFSVCDKVVGKAAAFLYVLLEIKEIFAFVISDLAVEILEENGIKVYYKTKVKRIENRNKDGFCPMEEAVLNCKNPKEGYFLIKEKLKTL